MNQYLILRRNRNEGFSITVGYLFDKLSLLIGDDAAAQFHQECINKNEELENEDIINLGQEFMAIAGKSTIDRNMEDDDRKREILRLLRGKVPQSQLDSMIQDANKEENRIKQREKAAELRRQRSGANVMSGRIDDEKEEKKQQGSLGLPLPQAQRQNAAQKDRRQSIEMTVTFEEENGIEHIGQSSESSRSRTVTPIRQSGTGIDAIEIEEPKEKSKTPEQQVDLQIGAESEPPTIPDSEQKENNKSESEPTIIIQILRRQMIKNVVVQSSSLLCKLSLELETLN